MMNNSQSKSSAFLKEGMGYLINGIRQCFSLMEKGGMTPQNGDGEVYELTEKLKNLMDGMSPSDQFEQKNEIFGGQDEELIAQGREDQLIKFRSELHLARRINKKLRRANIKLKKTNKRLRRRSKKNHKNRKISQMSPLESKERNKFEEIISNLQESLKFLQKNKQEAQNAKNHKNQSIATSTSNDQTRGISYHKPPKNEGQLAPKLKDRSKKVSEKAIQVFSTIEQVEQLLPKTPLSQEVKAWINYCYSKEQEELEYQSRLSKMTLTAKKVKAHKQKGLIGRDVTLLALKNPSSYLIATSGKGLKLIENEVLVYSTYLKDLGLHELNLDDAIYVESMNCYFFFYDEHLYRKDIDENRPYLYMRFQSYSRAGTNLVYSRVNESLLELNYDTCSLDVIDLKNKKKEIEIKHERLFTNYGRKLKVFGEKEDSVICFGKRGEVWLFKINYAEKVGSLASSYTIQLNYDRREKVCSVAVCDKGNLVLVEIGAKKKSSIFSSRLVLLRVDKAGELLPEAVLDVFDQELRSKYTLECFGSFGRHIMWMGLSIAKNGIAQVYDYDTETGDLKEVPGKRINHQEKNVYRIERFENDFYYTGKMGRLVKLALNF